MRLNQVTLGSTDIGRSERFYRLLGLQLIVKTDDYLRFECPAGDSTFSVERGSSIPIPADAPLLGALPSIDIGDEEPP